MIAALFRRCVSGLGISAHAALRFRWHRLRFRWKMLPATAACYARRLRVEPQAYALSLRRLRRLPSDPPFRLLSLTADMGERLVVAVLDEMEGAAERVAARRPVRFGDPRLRHEATLTHPFLGWTHGEVSNHAMLHCLTQTRAAWSVEARLPHGMADALTVRFRFEDKRDCALLVLCCGARVRSDDGC